MKENSVSRVGEIYPATDMWGKLLDLSCQPFTHNVSFMNVACADLILFRAEVEAVRCTHENTAEHPADPFDILIPQQGNIRSKWKQSCDMITWMPSRGSRPPQHSYFRSFYFLFFYKNPQCLPHSSGVENAAWASFQKEILHRQM